MAHILLVNPFLWVAGVKMIEAVLPDTRYNTSPRDSETRPRASDSHGLYCLCERCEKAK